MSGITSRRQVLSALLLLLCLAALSHARPAKYLDNKTLNRQITSLAAGEPNLVRVTRIAGRENHRSQILELGAGADSDRAVRPAMLVVAGIEGNDLAGSTIAMAWMRQLLRDYGRKPEITALLDTRTIYVLPRLNTQGAAAFFAEPRVETRVNGRRTDDDHDGLKDEDGPDDLNGDGLITSMRVRDDEGAYILDPADKRLLIKADPLKGESGKWRLLREGRDDDKDERYNEDGPGGVNFNRNYPYNYPYFANDAGVHQVSEAKTRALADFVAAHPNIALVVTFGAADNVLAAPKGGSPQPRKPMDALDENDVGYYRAMGELYRDKLGLEDELQTASYPGTFSDWMYFHKGRLSLAINPWSPELAVKLFPSEEKDEPSQDEDQEDSEPKTEDDDRNSEQRLQLKWFDENCPQAFLPWRKIEHPDFRGKRVEIGGWAPFAWSNPPEKLLGDIVARQVAFLTAAASKLPAVEIGETRVKHLGKDVYDITIELVNRQFLPTSLVQGRRSRQVAPARLVIELPDKQFLSGRPIIHLPMIPGSGGEVEVRCVMHAPDRKKIEFKVVSTLAGSVAGSIELPAAGN